MAVVGDAYIVVKAITSGFESEVRRAASGINLERDGKSVGETFSRGFSGGVGTSLSSSLSGFEKSAIRARRQFQGLIRTGYLLGPLISQLLSGIGALAGGLVSLASSLVAAAPASVVFASALTSIGIAAAGLLGALKGVGTAITAGSKARKGSVKDTGAEEEAIKRLLRATERVTEAQYDFAKATAAAKEEIQQLGFDAEDAALGEKKAAIELEKARETLQRVQDLPPNSRARREAQLAFAEADLNLRKAKDRNSDLRKEQESLGAAAKKAGTEVYQQTDTYLDAKKNEIDAIRDQKDAQDALTKVQTGGTADTAFADAMAGLSKEAQGFVTYMVNVFMPSLKELRDALGERLFSQLEAGLEKLRTKLFPELKPVLVDLGDSIGKAFGTIIDAITEIENIGDLKQVIANAGINIESYARTAGNLYDSFLSVLVSAQPLAEKFNKFLEKKTAGWAAYLDAKQATGELQAMFDKAGDIAARIGAVFGNAISGIVNITRANFTPGGGGYILLDYFKDVTAEFEKFSGSVAGQDALSDYFKGVAENSKAVLGSLGAFIKEILKAGADPNVKVFFDILKTAAPILGEMLTQLNSSGPALAKFLVSFAEFSKVTLSSGAITVFWNTLTGVLKTVTAVLSNPAVKEFFDNAAKVLAFFSALGLISSTVVFAGKVIVGSLLSISKVLTFLINPMAALRTAIAPLAAALGAISAPVLIIIGVVAALVAVFALAYKNSESFREAIGSLVTAVGGALTEAFSSIKEAISGAAPMLSGLKDIFKTIGDVLAVTVVPILKVVLVGAIKTVSGLIVGLINTISGIGNAFGSIGGAVSRAFSTVISVVRGAINSLINLWNSTLGKLKISLPKIGPFGGGTIGFPTIPNFADGGIVYPSAGGTIARVAEAGRPERIEPLDANGLSVRDKAMIELLANNTNNKSTDLTVNVYPSQGMNESELASIVSRQIAFQLRRGGA
jgi:phage-related protein